MLFNSLDFAVFLPIVFALYWLLNKKLRIQNVLLIAASYIFYGWWDWRFLLLIVISSLIDFLVGLQLQNEKEQHKRKGLLWISLVVNLGLLIYFKYYNFFLDNFIEAFSLFGVKLNLSSLHIILPVGISFYTFQTLSYTIDVYRRKVAATNDAMAFFAYVSFFPQLVAGPIERASNLLPQFKSKRVFDYYEATDGLRQILWGFFKKMVIADNCAYYVDVIFSNSDKYGGSTLLLGAIFFAFQIYCDFSGYSDIAIGTASLFGFNLMKNFAFPYFSRDIAEFWRRWHISLSTWFRDYLYIPLGGSRGNYWMKIRNTSLIFIVVGLWHGANWTFIVWGTLNALYFLPLLLAGSNRKNLQIVARGKYIPKLIEVLKILATFSLVTLAWIFFRAESVGHAMQYISGIFSPSLFSSPHLIDPDQEFVTVAAIIVFIIIEWFGKEYKYALERIGNVRPVYLKYAITYILIMAIIFYMANNERAFIYFEF